MQRSSRRNNRVRRKKPITAERNIIGWRPDLRSGDAGAERASGGARRGRRRLEDRRLAGRCRRLRARRGPRRGIEPPVLRSGRRARRARVHGRCRPRVVGTTCRDPSGRHHRGVLPGGHRSPGRRRAPRARDRRVRMEHDRPPAQRHHGRAPRRRGLRVGCGSGLRFGAQLRGARPRRVGRAVPVARRALG